MNLSTARQTDTTAYVGHRDDTEAVAKSAALTATDWGLLILRIGLGVIFVAHGCQKVFGWFGGHGLEGTAAMMHGGLGIPVPLAYVASFTELLGGLAVLLGLFTRIGAAGIAVVMVVAIATVHWKNGFFLEKQGFEYPMALLAMALSLIVAGPGRIAIADLEGRLIGSRHEKGRT
jgi:putative oxidoreductase